MKNNNVILIGFMGVGKGTLARYIAKNAQIVVVDTDDIIESFENKKIKKIFKDNGEEYFRELELRVAKWIDKNITKSVISTGGGFYKVDNISSLGKIVYLKSSFEGILNRINSAPNAKEKLKKRPLLQDEKKAKELFHLRDKEYLDVANIVIDVESRKIEDIYRELDSYLNFNTFKS